MEEEPTWVEKVFLFGVVATIVLLMWMVVHLTGSRARDVDGKYAKADPKLHEWFESLQSGEGYCCADADGMSLSDVDWEVRGDNYWVRIPSDLNAPRSSEPVWVEVPDNALVKQPNRVGRTIVWPIWHDGSVAVRCFMPGTMG